MEFEPHFTRLDASERWPRFVVLHRPESVPSALVAHVPAFGDEMNKSRRMVSMQARALAAAGAMVLVLDPLGTGDSPGDHGAVAWDDWVRDIASGVGWLRREFARRWPGQPEPTCVLWGLRAGALLAAAAAHVLPRDGGLLLWQPAVHGRTVLQQLLRLMSAGAVLAGRGAAVGTTAARDAMAAGRTLEIGGYAISPALTQGLEAASLLPGSPPLTMAVIEVASKPEASPSLPLAKLLTRWREAGGQATIEVVQGPAFWHTTEIEDAPELIAATCRLLAVLAAPSPAAPMASLSP